MNGKAELRALNGVLLLDKSPGMTSNAALQKAKRLLRARKAGHTGSLDPIASGLLPICLGEATKLSAFLLNTDKRYQVHIRLGVTTETGDIEGRVVAVQPVPDLDEAAIERVLAGFRGEILQVPPMYSALKYQGRRLYDLARQGIEVERAPRAVTIHALRLLARDEGGMRLDVHCSKGTYIRTLAEDIGRALGCGGHVMGLRRTAVGDLVVEDAHDLEQLAALADADRPKLLLSMDRIVAEYPAVRLSDELVFFLRRGEPVLVPKAPICGWVRLYGKESVFLGLGEILDDGRIAPRRMLKTPARSPAQKERIHLHRSVDGS